MHNVRLGTWIAFVRNVKRLLRVLVHDPPKAAHNDRVLPLSRAVSTILVPA
jgi:hypothetical protein